LKVIKKFEYAAENELDLFKILQTLYSMNVYYTEYCSASMQNLEYTQFATLTTIYKKFI